MPNIKILLSVKYFWYRLIDLLNTFIFSIKWSEVKKIKGWFSGISFIIEYKGFNFFNIGFGTGLRLSSHDKMVYEKSLTVQTLILRLNLKFVEIYKYILQVTDTWLYLQYDGRIWL